MSAKPHGTRGLKGGADELTTLPTDLLKPSLFLKAVDSLAYISYPVLTPSGFAELNSRNHIYLCTSHHSSQ